MTERAPAPVFRRFPWLQLVFCVACLSMAAWTWMRYSYVWDVTVGDLYLRHRSKFSGKRGMPADPATRWRWPAGAYVHVFAEVGRDDFAHRPDGRPVRLARDPSDPEIAAAAIFDKGLSEGPLGLVSLVGRAGVLGYSADPISLIFADLDTTASRFHPASVGGLFVGVMGVFIFGLYLRRWVKERRAA